MGSTIKHQAKMALKFCLVFTVVTLPNCLATFAATDAFENCIDGHCNQKLNLRRQILEEILAEIEKKELAAKRQLQQPQLELQEQGFELQQRQLILQQQQRLQGQQILSQHVQQHQQQHQFQVQQNQLKNQIQRLLLEELPQNNQLIDSLTEKTYEVALICRSSKCAGEFDFDKKKELTKVIKPFTEVFIARMFNLVTPETV